MQENEQMTTGFEEEGYEPLLPDGWQEGDDIFAGEDNWGDDEGAADEQTAAAVEDQPEQTETTEEAEVPTTDVTAETDVGQEAETQVQETPARAPRVLQMKVNHKTYDVDVDQLSDDAIVERFQKAAAFDAMREQQQKQRYRQIYQDQIYAGMTEDAAHMVATHKCGKSYPLTDQPEAPAAQPVQAPAQPQPAAPARNIQAEVDQVKAIYRDFDGIPHELVKEIAEGKSVLAAYAGYRERQSAKAAADLKKENAVLKQNAAAAARAPVKGVTGNGATGTKPADPFMQGFNDGY